MSIKQPGLPDELSYKKLDEEEFEKICATMTGFKSSYGGFIRVGKDEFFIPRNYLNHAQNLYNFKFRPSDILTMTFPKSGTMWLNEIIWTMVHNSNFDHPRALDIVTDRTKELEFDIYYENLHEFNENHPEYENFTKACPGKDPKNGVFLQMAEVEPDIRVMKTHLPFLFYHPSLLDKTKVVYMARNIRDVIMSAYYFVKANLVTSFIGTGDDLVDIFFNDQAFPLPYWKHIAQAWKRRDHPNLLFLFYEDMKLTPEKEIGKLNKFLGTNLTDLQITNVAQYVQFKNMKKRDAKDGKPRLFYPVLNPEVQKTDDGFFRKGKIGSWKEDKIWGEENEKKLAAWIEKNEKELGINFKYEN